MDDLGDAAGVAAAALHDDPFFVHMSPEGELRRRRMPIFWRASLAGTHATGETFGAFAPAGHLVAVASWVPPGRYPLPALAQVRQAAGAVRALLPRPAKIPDAARALLALDRVHPKHEHWYLNLLTVEPLSQGKGLGRDLVEIGIQRAEEEGLPAYLETSRERNLAWYGRFGFNVVAELHPLKKGPPLWTMERPAP
jgi:ribosomal protein S18 acetylase RimI-like enzyme